MDIPEIVASEPYDMTLPESAKPQGIGTAIALGLAFALCGMLIALRDFAVQVLPHIVMPRDISRFQEIADGSPIPKTLDWNANLIDFLIVLRDPNPVLAIVVVLGLGVVLWMVAIALLNPTFRPIGAAQSGKEAETASVQPLTKAFHILLRLILPVGMAWALASVFLSGKVGFGIQVAILIFGLSIGYRRDGLAGDFTRAEFNYEKIPYLKFLITSAIFAVLIALIRTQLPQSLEPTLEMYQMLGTFHQRYLRETAEGWFGMMGALWFLSAVLLFGMARTIMKLRLLSLGLGLIGFAAAIINGINLHPLILSKYFDAGSDVKKSIQFPYTPQFPHTGISTGTEGAELLARRLHLSWREPKEDPPTHNLIIFEQRPLFVGIGAYTDDGQPIEPQSLSKIADYYQRTHGRTALNWNALRWQMSAALVHFDNSKGLELAIQDLINAPHVTRTGRFVREIFFTCAANARNLASLDKLANERDFAFPDRESLRMMGDLYRRFGDKEKALAWYRRAEMPQSFLKARQEEKSMFRQGTVRGKLTLGGKPLAGVQVGVLPRRLNGLPRDLEGSLFGAIEEIIPRFYRLRGNYVRSSLPFRWISTSAITDANGNFQLNDLTEGEYAFVTTLSPQNAPKRYDESNIQVRYVPVPFVLSYNHRVQDLGTIAFRLNDVPTSGQSR